MQQNMQTLKNEGFVINLDKGSTDNQKYLEHSNGKAEDALNTLSGSQSFQSMGSATHELEEHLQKIYLADYASEGELERSKQSHTSIREDLSEP